MPTTHALLGSEPAIVDGQLAVAKSGFRANLTATQFRIRLTHTVSPKPARSLVGIPDRAADVNELWKFRAVIRENRPGSRSTHTLRSFTEETQTVVQN